MSLRRMKYVSATTKISRAVISSQRLLLATVFLAAISAICDQYAVADEYVEQEPHEHPVSRQFWRDVEEQGKGLEPSWFQRPYLAGDWLGQRRTLAAWGITPTLTYVGDILSNPLGGQHRKVAYTHSIGADVEINLEKLAALKGLTVYVSAAAQTGRDLSAIALGNVFTVSAVAGNETVRLYNLEVEQSLFGDKLSLLLQPDVQYLIRPGGTGRIPDALVLGVQFSVNF